MASEDDHPEVFAGGVVKLTRSSGGPCSHNGFKMGDLLNVFAVGQTRGAGPWFIWVVVPNDRNKRCGCTPPHGVNTNGVNVCGGWYANNFEIVYEGNREDESNGVS